MPSKANFAAIRSQNKSAPLPDDRFLMVSLAPLSRTNLFGAQRTFRAGTPHIGRNLKS